MATRRSTTGVMTAIAMAALHAPPGFRSPEPHRYSSGTPVKPYRPSHNTPHQGEREKARRLRQAERAKAKAVQP